MIAYDLYCGLGGWTEGLLLEGYDVTGFDITAHEYGDMKYPAKLIVRDVLTIDGAKLADADLIVASPPCQEFSYMAMPWKRAKAKAQAIRADTSGKMLADLTRLFDACFRIQREASAAAGRHIPMIVENVRGAQPWVGRSRWHYGSFHLWGDVPALMPMIKHIAKRPGHDWNRFNETGEISPHWRLNGEDSLVVNPAIKRFDGSGKSFQAEHVKCGGDWFEGKEPSQMRHHSSKSNGRKMASAMIAKIPLPLSRHIARVYAPQGDPPVNPPPRKP